MGKSVVGSGTSGLMTSQGLYGDIPVNDTDSAKLAEEVC